MATNSVEASLPVYEYDPLLQVLELLRGFLVIYCIAVVISTGVLCNRLASAKGLPQEPWMWAGFLLGPLALIAAAGMPDKKTRTLIRENSQQE